MDKLQVFLSSAMNGELDVERAALKQRFGSAPALANTFELWTFESGAEPIDARLSYRQEVEKSAIVILVFANTLRDAVRDEFFAAVRSGAAILCYVKGGIVAEPDLSRFIGDQVTPRLKYSRFDNEQQLCDKVEHDVHQWQIDTFHRTSAQLRARQRADRVATLNTERVAAFCEEALADSDPAETTTVPVDLCAHSLWGTVRPVGLDGLPSDRQREIEEYAGQIDTVVLHGAVLPALKRGAQRGLRFAVRVLLLHPDSEQAREVDHSQRLSSEPAEKARFAFTDIYLTIYVLRRLTRDESLGLSVVRVLPQHYRMGTAFTRIGNAGLVAPYPDDQLLDGTMSFTVHRGTDGDFGQFSRKVAEFDDLWEQAAAHEMTLDSLPMPFEALRRAVDDVIGRTSAVPWPRASDDPTPFQTRTKLLTVYRTQVDAIRDGKDPYPVALEINPASFCDQTCHWCISEDKHERGVWLDVEDGRFVQFVQDFAAVGGKVVGWSGGGEPTNHPHLARAMATVAAAGLEQGLMTHGAFAANGALMDAIVAHCRWVRVSIDTDDPKEYARRRGHTDAAGQQAFDRVMANVHALVQRNVHVGLNVNVAHWNLDRVDRIYDCARRLGAAYLQVRPTLPTPFPHRREDREEVLAPTAVPGLLDRLKALERHAADADTKIVVSYDKFEDIRVKNYGRGYRGCVAHRIFVVLNANGDLAVCMYQMTDTRFIFGNIYTERLKSIWESQRRKEAIRFCNTGLDHTMHGCQVCCKGHEINKVLEGKVRDVQVPAGASRAAAFI
jgi:MoaA/NifB/PqqE/SkfB family radical SAM enzyme